MISSKWLQSNDPWAYNHDQQLWERADTDMHFGIHLGDEPLGVSARTHLSTLLRIVEAGQEAGFTYFTLGQHFGYRGIRWLQPVPTLARLCSNLDRDARLGTSILIAPLYPPVMLAEEIATLDIISDGQLVVGLGTGYLPEEYAALGVDFNERYARLDELLQLLPLLWTQPAVSFDGRFTQLTDTPTHIHPLQRPGPPIWVGAMAQAGVRRAARLADAWTITPQQTITEIDALIRVYANERTRTQRPFGYLPLRREIHVGSSFEHALDTFTRNAHYKYDAYVNRGMNLLSAAQVRDSFDETVANHVILGTAESCRQQIVDIAGRIPVDPIIFRPHWPGMDVDDAIEDIQRIGREIVHPLRDLSPITMQEFMETVE